MKIGDGQTYSFAASWVMHDAIYVGQRMMPESEYRIVKISFDIGQELAEGQAVL
jgi:hypothetical protein